MRFDVGTEEAAFAESVRAALVNYRPPEWFPGAALDDRDPSLSSRLDAVGLAEAIDAGHGFVAAAGIELGRALAPLAPFDELAVADAALAIAGFARYAGGHATALNLCDDGVFLVPLEETAPEPALDSQGFAHLTAAGDSAPFPDLRGWASFHTAYLAGLAGSALALAVEHARARVQFGKPLLALAPIEQMLADAATLARGIELVAWEETDDPWPGLVHAGEAACRVCEVSHQVHGAVGFALEAPIHSFFRRAHATRLFTGAAARVSLRLRAAV
jgi:butyryl-CoA dehydrogenase